MKYLQRYVSVNLKQLFISTLSETFRLILQVDTFRGIFTNSELFLIFLK